MVPAKVTPTTTPPALNPYRYAEKKIQRVVISFTPHSPNTRMACHIADTVDDARLYRIGYCQNGKKCVRTISDTSMIIRLQGACVENATTNSMH